MSHAKIMQLGANQRDKTPFLQFNFQAAMKYSPSTDIQPKSSLYALPHSRQMVVERVLIPEVY
jgi:hypothetical protein